MKRRAEIIKNYSQIIKEIKKKKIIIKASLNKVYKMLKTV